LIGALGKQSQGDLRKMIHGRQDLFMSYSFLFRQALVKENRLRFSKLLDVGCGTGNVAYALAPLCDFIVGIDVDDKKLAVAHQRLLGAGISEDKFVLVHGNFESLASKLGDSDLICCGMSFHHFANSSQAAFLRSMLKPQGILIIVDYVTQQNRFGSAYILEQLALPIFGSRSVLPAIAYFGLRSVIKIILGRVSALTKLAVIKHIMEDLAHWRIITPDLLQHMIEVIFPGADLFLFPGGVFLLKFTAPATEK
jgi:ubiquinone/menaquinone biosynthesis C-methylase UbiE